MPQQSDEYAWFREQLDPDARAKYREERFRDQALAEIGEKFGVETDAAFIERWTTWAEDEERRKVAMSVLDGIFAPHKQRIYNEIANCIIATDHLSQGEPNDNR